MKLKAICLFLCLLFVAPVAASAQTLPNNVTQPFAQFGLTGTVTLVRSGPFVFYGAYCVNASATLGAALQLFNAVPAAVTLGTTVPIAEAWIPAGGASGSGVGLAYPPPTNGAGGSPQFYNTALSVAATTGLYVGSGTGNTGAAANQIACWEYII